VELIDFSLWEVLAAVVVLFGASVVRGYSGFGFSAVLVAGLAFFVDPIDAVPLAIGLEVLASIVQGSSVWNDIDWPRLWVLLAAAVVGNPIGVELLTSVDADVLRGSTFIILAVLTVGLLANRTTAMTATPLIVFGVGVLAGVVNGATAMSGLVLVLAMTALSVAPAEMRGTLVAYFFASDLVVMVLLWWRGELSDVYAWRLALAIPVMAAGVMVGSRMFRGASVESFRRSTLYLLLAISVVGLARLLIA